MKTVYINENMLNRYLIKENILKDSLPYDIVSTIVKNNTSLGKNPAIPDIYEIPFLVKIANKRFHDLRTELQKIGKLNVKSSNLYEALAEMINKCKEIEKPFRAQLETLCFNIISELFQIPEDSIDFDIALTDTINYGDFNINIDPDESMVINFNDIKEGLYIKNEIFKKRILNALIMGAAMDFSSKFENYIEEIKNINPELFDLYKNIIVLNNYLLFEKEDVGIDDNIPKQMGCVEVYIGGPDERIKIKSRSLLFPILLNETIKGLMEIFIAHGLPKNKKYASYILNKTDFIKSEPWNMRIGPELWKLLTMSFNDINSNEIPYLMKRISKLDVDKFNFLMKEVFAKTRKGKEIMSFICNKAKDDMDYNRFINKMDRMKLNNSLITDEYIHENEL